MKYDFDHACQRFGTYSLKWDDDDYFRAKAPNIRLDQDTIRLLLADMDFRCAPAIAKAMRRVADFENYGYTTAGSTPEYKSSIINWYQRRHGTTIKPEWIIHSNGALDGVGQAIQAFSDVGDGVIICCPVYSNFRETINRANRKIVNCQMKCNPSGQYEMDWEKFEEVCAVEENKVFILCSPENPVGRVWHKDELRKMADICRKHGVVLVSDEIHCDIVRKGVKHVPIIDAVEDNSNVILVSGVNKSFNLMGLHCAYSVIPHNELRAKFCENYSPNMPTAFAIAGMIAAYEESEDWLDELNQYLDEVLQYTVAYLGQKMPKVKAYVPEGTYILWLDFSEYGYPPDILQYIINHKANIAVQGGLSHDPEQGSNYIRFCVTSPRAVIVEAIDRMAVAFDEFEKEKK